MTLDPIPPEVRSFISGHVRSISGIRLLLLLQLDPRRAWSAAELALELRSSPEWAGRELEMLVAQGLVAEQEKEPGRFRFSPRTQEQSNLIAKLASLYPEWQHAIIRILFSSPRDSIQSFADAFRLRKDNPDG